LFSLSQKGSNYLRWRRKLEEFLMNKEKKLSNYFDDALDFWENEQSIYLSNLPIAKSKGCLQAFVISRAFFERYKEDIHYGSKESFLGKVQSRMTGDLLEITKKDWFWQELFSKFKDFTEITTEQRKGARNIIQRNEELTPAPYLSLQDMTEGERGVFSNRADWLSLYRKIDEMNKTSEGIEAGKTEDGATKISSNWLTTQDYRILNRILVSWPTVEWKLNDYLDKYRNLFYRSYMGLSWSGTERATYFMPDFSMEKVGTSGKPGRTGEEYIPNEEGEDKPFNPKLPYEENLKNRIAMLQREWKVAGPNDQKIIEKNINSCHRLIKGWTAPIVPKKLEEFDQSMNEVIGFENFKKELRRYVKLWNKYGEKMDQVFYCLLGPAGVGKSFICGLVAEAFGRPFININIGKAEASDLVGSDPTYRGSNYGKIVGGMIEHQHRAPVILLDEFEKVRKDEITNMISIITDKSKNGTDFDDSYFGYTVPLNKCFILLTGNDRSKVPGFLDSRVVYVELKPYSYGQRLAIVKQELKKSLKLYDLERYLGNFSDEVLEKCITETWGVRQSKENAQGLARQLAEMEIDGEVPGDFDNHEWSFVEARDEGFDKGMIEDWAED
jgi:hypothetical protein